MWIADPDHRGVLNYYKDDQRKQPDWVVHLFLSRKFQGTLTESREGILQWFSVDQLPLGEMWEDYRYWCQPFLEGRELEGEFFFIGEFEKLRDHRLRIL